MVWLKRGGTISRIGIAACLQAWFWILLSSATASAHAILLRSNPPIGAVVKSLPTRVQMSFNEDLNPTFTTAYVLDVSKGMTKTLDDKTMHDMKQSEQILAGQVQHWLGRLIRVLRWEPLLGVAVLICTGLLHMFAGMLQPVAPFQNAGSWTQQLQTPAKPLVTKIETMDGLFEVTLTVTPNHQGFSAIAVAIFTRRSVRRRSPNSAVPKFSTAHFSACSSPSLSICLAPFVYIASPSSLPDNVLNCQIELRTPDDVIHHGQIELLIP